MFSLYCAGDDFVNFTTTYSLSVGGPLPPTIFDITAKQDDISENTEGFVVYLKVGESELDERDVGQVDLVRDAYLAQILDVTAVPPLGIIRK